jgi:hypothetical protein
MAGTLLRFTGAMRGLRISWFTVGIQPSFVSIPRLEPEGHSRAVSPDANSGQKPLFTVLPEQNAEEADDRFVHAGLSKSLVKRTLFETNSRACRSERRCLTSAQTRRVLQRSPESVNPEGRRFCAVSTHDSHAWAG